MQWITDTVFLRSYLFKQSSFQSHFLSERAAVAMLCSQELLNRFPLPSSPSRLPFLPSFPSILETEHRASMSVRSSSPSWMLYSGSLTLWLGETKKKKTRKNTSGKAPYFTTGQSFCFRSPGEQPEQA